MVEAFLGIQIVATLFALFMIYVALLHFKRNNLGKLELIFWITIWLLLIFFALFPRTLDPWIKRLFIARVLDLVIIGGLIILTYLGFANHMGVKHLQRRIEQLARQSAYKNAKKNK
jgi:hypothetical protein